MSGHADVTTENRVEAGVWQWRQLGKLCRTTSGGTPSRKRSDYFEGHIPWVKSGELPDGPIIAVEESITDEAVANSSAKVFPAGTLLIALYGATVGKLGILTRAAATNQAVCAVFPPKELEARFLFWYLRYRRSNLIAQAVGGAQPNISQTILRSLEVPVPPIDQQRRIVAEIEKQFSRIDEAVDSLKRLKTNLKRYKVAVLNAAVAGRLVTIQTQLAQQEGRPIESTEHILERISATRRSQWQGESKYKDPAKPDPTGLPELPGGWVWVTFEQVSISRKHALKAGPFGSALKKEHYVPSGYKVYGQEQVIRGDHRFGDYFIDEKQYRELKSYATGPGDLLLSLVGTTGRVLVLPHDAQPGIINPRLLKLSLNSSVISPAYAAYMLQSTWATNFFKSKAHGGTMEILNLGIVKALAVPLPPYAEQTRIVSEIDRLFSIADAACGQTEGVLKRAQSLRNETLARKFAPSARQ